MLSHPVSPSLSTSHTASPQPPRSRLRQACDSCTSSKVKCDKTRPACQRCLENDQPCEYSASRRYGKRVKLAPPPNQPLPSVEETPLAGQLQPPAIDAECYDPSQFFDMNWENSSAALPITQTTSTLTASHEMDDFSNSISSGLPDLASPNHASLYDQWWSGFASQHGVNMSLSTPQIPVGQESSSIGRTTCVDATSKSTSESSSIAIEHAFECEARAMNVLRSLHYNLTEDNLSAKASITTAMATSHRSASAVHTVDSLLFTNKAALNELTKMRDCRCNENPHIATLHLSILYKVVFWYKVSVTARYYSENVQLRPMRIQFGMLDLDDEECASLHRVALIRELHKASSMIQAFESRCSADGAPVASKMSPWSRMGLRAVGEELQQIIQETEASQMKRRSGAL